MDQLTEAQVDAIAQQFREIGCTVSEITGSGFQIVPPKFPAMTLVTFNPCFLEFGTCVFARPQRFLGRCRLKRDALLNAANRTAHIARFTSDEEKVDRETGCWTLTVTAKLVTGEIATAYTTEALGNLLNLWLQDLANVIKMPAEYELIAMLQKE